jgi:CheY-like chemotaxis protein
MAPINFLSCLVSDELTRRGDRLLERRRKQAQFRDPQVTLDNFDFNFNKKMNRSLVFDLATATFIARREDALFLGPPGTGKSHLAQAIGQAVIGQGYRVIYREALRLSATCKGQIDPVLADFILPGLRGLEVAAKVLEIHANARVILMSGYADRDLSAGDEKLKYHFVQKPLDLRTLAQQIRVSLAPSAERIP